MIGYIPKSPPLFENVKSRPLLTNLLTALIYWLSSSIGLQLTVIYGNVSPIWPSSGFAVAAMYFAGYRLLPGILIGAISSYISAEVHTLSALVIALGNCSEAAIAAWLLGRARPLVAYLGQYTTPIWLLATSLIASSFSATIGSYSILYIDTNPIPIDFWQAFITWFAGNMIGILIIVPVILTLKRPTLSWHWFIKFFGLSALTLLVYAVILSNQSQAPLLFLAFIPLIPACRWFGQAGCAWSTLSFVIFATVAILTNPDSNILATSNYELLSLDAFLISLSITSLTIATLYKSGQFLIPTVLLCIGWLSGGLIDYTLQSNALKADEANFIKLTHDIELAITERLSTYADALIAAAGIYINSDELQPSEWQSFVNHLKLDQRYPGINGLGFIQPFDDADLAQFVVDKRASGLPDFEIKNVPGVERPPADLMGYEHYIITYIEPLDINRQALGLDVASEINRQTAGQHARDTGRPAMSDRIILVQDGMARPGFLFFYPMYRPDTTPETVDERREAFIGWSYAPFITEIFLDGVLGNRADQIQFEIYDSPTISADTFVYSTNKENTASQSDSSKFAHTSRLELADQTYSFGWNHGESFQKQETASATIAAASLSLGSCLLVVIVVNLQSTNRRAKIIVEDRTRALENANEKLRIEVNERQKAESDANKAHEAADAANSAKSEFLATMSHEIRTPMNSVIGFAELLCGSPLNDDQRQWASYIQSSGSSLLNLINDILDFSKIEAGKFDLEFIPFSIRRALDEVVNGFTPTAKQKGLNIQLIASDALPEKVIGDPTRLKQVLTNLIGNALKFTPQGHIIVSAQWTGNNENGFAQISVADSGIGIPKEKIKNLFQRFSQVDSSTTRQYGGTGLGLAICKRIVNLMNGTIQVDSSDGKGTTISFKIPFAIAQRNLSKDTPAHISPSHLNEAQAHKRSVLIVDDNAVNRKLGETVVRRLGHTVETANNGLEAIESVKEKFYDIVFLDCQMPVLDGYEATRQIRQLEIQGKIPGSTQEHPLPIIALTANASEKDREACLECGMDAYICKPARIGDFNDALKNLDGSPRAALP